MKSRVRWNFAEERAVAVRAAELMNSENLLLPEAIEQAQYQVLPKERWKKRDHGRPAPITREIRRVLSELIANGQSVQPIVESDYNPGARATLGDLYLLLKQLSQKVDQLAAQLIPSVPVEEPAAPDFERPNGKPLEMHRVGVPTKERPLKVRVMGLLPDQLRAVQNKIGDRARIEEWRGRSHCDVAIGVTGFMQHSQEEMLKRSGGRYVRVGRGTGSVIAAIRRELEGKGT